MVFRYEIADDSIECFLSAPTTGWLMLGFNNLNSTSSADFKFFHILSGVGYSSDRINIGGRNYPEDTSLRGENNITLRFSRETKSQSMVSFSIPLTTNDSNDFQHNLNQPFWLILAYSSEDDFLHHSRMRKHLPFKWEPK